MADSGKWIAITHVGKFRRGRIYTSTQLGVLGRMAAYSGHLIPYVEPLPSGRKKLTAAQRRKKGWADGEAPVQAGGSQDVRDESGS